MKILIVAEVFYPEDFIINDLANHWNQKGFNVSVLTRVPSYPKDNIFDGYKNKIFQVTYWKRIKIYRLPVVLGYQSSKIKKILNYVNFVLIGSIFALFNGHKYDHVFIYQTGPLTLALPGILITKIFKKKTTLWTQDLWPDTVYAYGFKKTKFLSNLLNKLVGFIYGSTTNILASCEGFKDKIRYYVPDKNIEWVPNWALTKSSELNTKITFPKGFHFLFAGNVGKVQNLENVIKGFGEVTKSRKNIFLHIVGDGSNLTNIKNLVNELELINVIFYGRKPLDEMTSYFEAADALIISLIDQEIFNLTIPSKFQSYLVAEKPMLGIIGGEVKSLIEKYNLGLSAHPNDIAEISEKMIEFINLPESMTLQIKENSRNLYNKEFRKEIIIEKIDSIIII